MSIVTIPQKIIEYNLKQIASKSCAQLEQDLETFSKIPKSGNLIDDAILASVISATTARHRELKYAAMYPHSMSNKTYVAILDVYTKLGKISYVGKTADECKDFASMHSELTKVLQENDKTIGDCLHARGIVYGTPA